MTVKIGTYYIDSVTYHLDSVIIRNIDLQAVQTDMFF